MVPTHGWRLKASSVDAGEEPPLSVSSAFGRLKVRFRTELASLALHAARAITDSHAARRPAVSLLAGSALLLTSTMGAHADSGVSSALGFYLSVTGAIAQGQGELLLDMRE